VPCLRFAAAGRAFHSKSSLVPRCGLSIAIPHATFSKFYLVVILNAGEQTHVSSSDFLPVSCKKMYREEICNQTVLDTLFRLSPSELLELTFKFSYVLCYYFPLTTKHTKVCTKFTKSFCRMIFWAPRPRFTRPTGPSLLAFIRRFTRMKSSNTPLSPWREPGFPKQFG